MKIVIAAWHLKDFNVGLGRYCRGLIEAIGRVDRENCYEILMPDDSYRFPEQPNIRHRLVRFPLFKRRVWEQVAPLLAGRYDLLHFPYDSAIAWKRGRFVVTVHDVKPLIYGTDRSRWNLNRLIEGLLIGDKWASIDHILTDSQCSKRDIIKHLGIAQNRITVVYPGVDLQRFLPASEEAEVEAEVKKRGDSPSSCSTLTSTFRPYVLCVAGADPTKNVETLVEAFTRLPLPLRNSHDLVLTGDFRRRADLRELLGRTGIEKQTVFTGVVSDGRLIDLYQRASLFVFPSCYEGFGLPVLEAMACGCPVICSNVSSLPEVAGDAALQVDPLDADKLASEMTRVLRDSALCSDLRKRGLVQAGTFSWDRTARETIAVYKKVVEG
ncbi:MAG: glycosyltransferase family 4 protein [Nitrospiraceae bacterium]